jgi:hypothetical protein
MRPPPGRVLATAATQVHASRNEVATLSDFDVIVPIAGAVTVPDHATAAPASPPGSAPPDARGRPARSGSVRTPAPVGLSGIRYVLAVVLLAGLAWIPVLIVTAAGRLSLLP